MDKLLKSSFFVVTLIFLLSFGLALLAVSLAGVFSFKLAIYLFLATLISSIVSVTILGGFFTSLSSYLIHLRRLFRLNNITHPLLLRLSTEAPGTYHHSVLVADLSSRVAKAVGADSLLCRVSAYFHDIGKLKEPRLFIENQITSEENNLKTSQADSPKKSVKQILEHVKEGIKIAEEAHLPKEVINLIAQHHGTSFCYYFWRLAKERKLEIRRSDFRYEGPKPQTKEATILMLADSLEAKTRVKNSNFSLKGLVEETISEKTEDGQLKESHLSQKEIYKLKQVFVETLESMQHQRIEYQ